MKPIYSEYETEIVKTYYPIYGVKKCQEFIKRSAVSIHQRARVFNLRRVEGWRENQTPLDEIIDLNDPKFCYTLGLIWADGTISVNKKHYSVSLGLASSDLDSIKHLLSKHWRFYNRKQDKYPSWKPFTLASISHKKLAIWLESLDFKIKSSASPSKILNLIPESNKNYFFRGWHDGDSYSRGVGKNKLIYSISGTLNQNWEELEKISNVLNLDFYIKKNIYKDGNGGACFNIKGERSIRFWLNYIYSGEQFGIQRKYNDFLFFFEKRNSPKIPCGILKTFRRRSNKYYYMAKVGHRGNMVCSTYFESIQDAMIAYDDICVEKFKRDLTWLHFPNRYSSDLEYEKYGFSPERSTDWNSLIKIDV